MRTIYTGALIIIGLLAASAAGQEDKKTVSPKYDEALAKKWNADAYGMRKYVIAFLKTGENRSQDEETARQLQKAHMENIKRLADEGKLVVAGPFLDGGELRGIYIFAVESVEDAKKLTETDPAIKAGRLRMELHPWYGSASLMEINKLHEKAVKNNPF